MILERIRQVAQPGTVIPKPRAKKPYVVVRWGRSRGEDALVYKIPPRSASRHPAEKAVPASAFEAAWKMLMETGQITHKWFARTFPAVEAGGSCNFTTLGGIFVLLGEAVYDGPGVFRRTERGQSSHGPGNTGR